MPSAPHDGGQAVLSLPGAWPRSGGLPDIEAEWCWGRWWSMLQLQPAGTSGCKNLPSTQHRPFANSFSSAPALTHRVKDSVAAAPSPEAVSVASHEAGLLAVALPPATSAADPTTSLGTARRRPSSAMPAGRSATSPRTALLLRVALSAPPARAATSAANLAISPGTAPTSSPPARSFLPMST